MVCSGLESRNSVSSCMAASAYVLTGEYFFRKLSHADCSCCECIFCKEKGNRQSDLCFIWSAQGLKVEIAYLHAWQHQSGVGRKEDARHHQMQTYYNEDGFAFIHNAFVSLVSGGQQALSFRRHSLHKAARMLSLLAADALQYVPDPRGKTQAQRLRPALLYKRTGTRHACGIGVSSWINILWAGLCTLSGQSPVTRRLAVARHSRLPKKLKTNRTGGCVGPLHETNAAV